MSNNLDISERTPLNDSNLLVADRTSSDVNHLSPAIESDMSEISCAPEMDDTKRILFKILIDIVLLLFVGFPILAFFIWGSAYERGFFCDDESLMHPYHDSTVKNYYLYVIGVVLPICLIVICEVVQSKRSSSRKLVLFGHSIPTWISNSYQQIGVFGFGAAACQIITDIGKYSVGRYRPHFFNVCQPIMNDGTNCSNSINHGRYIEDFTCLGVGADARQLKEMRLSFPSGHASFTAYTMIYCAIYLQARMTWRGSKLLKHFIQLLLLIIAFYICVSRISDYKHHWSDVLAGATLGTFSALIVSNFVSNLFKNRNGNIRESRYELKSSGSV